MKREKKMILVAHCLLNVNAKVIGIANEAGGSSLIGKLVEKGYGIIQLPCIEMAMYGSQRWGVVYEQCDFLSYRNKCKELLNPIVEQVVDYSNHGYEIRAVIGADYSPTCGVNYTSKGKWSGELNEVNNYQEKIDSVEIKEGNGIMIEELSLLLRKHSLDVPFYGIEETDMSSYLSILQMM
ncbi:CD3072 family TudS-related putative desulfidase [Faecalicatena contorta]|uniref:Predicted secreted protein n=1 Tax=Faecalicatena contorta TaxID=39482 RepID=A0A315ZZY4_9FIRM|nr:CD3072 family TudS-related putative desulfidase [Faecalicatena contorta]PWJ50498.1 putative secreted protein [Faecalicatena contorta]SUQ13906.1 Predicted secreted protein [Faecalicatena contorta]